SSSSASSSLRVAGSGSRALQAAMISLWSVFMGAPAKAKGSPYSTFHRPVQCLLHSSDAAKSQTACVQPSRKLRGCSQVADCVGVVQPSRRLRGCSQVADYVRAAKAQTACVQPRRRLRTYSQLAGRYGIHMSLTATTLL